MAKAKKTASGNWRTQVYDFTDLNGKRHYKSFTAATKKESEYLANQFAMNKANKNNFIEYTVHDLLTRYLKDKTGSLSATTITGYSVIIRNHFDDIEHYRIEQLNSSIIQAWIGGLNQRLKPKSVHNAYGLLVGCINFYNIPMRFSVVLPQKIVRDLYTPTDDEVKYIIHSFRDKGDMDMVIAIYLAAYGTLRRGEICALTAADVKDNVITINKVMIETNGKWFIKPTPKTISSNRKVPYPQFVIDVLPKEGRLVNLTPDKVSSRFLEQMKRTDLPHFRFHDLRAYSVSIGHAIGISDQYLQERGGWSTDRTLKAIYRNSLSDYSKQYSDKLNDYFTQIQD